ncbi:MAG: long-chain-fatty-acid--CoA ligase [Candidatus Tectomicrobia bacterium]|uniref:Long-chain-fatty-acid--CoA ligase n=1 Tax=Tectimicrobiota bacterium TaxID=2528274 RepID=A0A938B1X0_UNCTE|nr:long-chain-fatty-acid--CoA ligase [Candidatus Tectomicrobia bacterium]
MFEPLLPLNFLRRATRLFATRTAVIDGAQRYTYQQLETRVHRLSNALRTLGVAQGDRVAVLSPNSHRMLEAFFAVPQLGAVLVPLNYRLTTPEFAYILAHSETKVVLIDWEYAHQLAPLVETLGGVQHYILLRDTEEPTASLPAQDYETLLATASPEFPQPVDIAETDIATLNYTSGTTARPKGVMLTHRACVMSALNYITSLNVVPTDVYLHTLPMFHANGWGGLWALAGRGGSQVCLRRVEAQRIFELMHGEHVTLACAAPTVLVTLATFPQAREYTLAPGVRIGTGGSPPAAAVLRNMEALGIEVIHLYGLTETGPFLTSCEWQPSWNDLDVSTRYRLKARQGIAQLLTDVRVMDEQLQEVPWDGQTIGEIVARGNNVMEGYYKQPEATAEAMRGGWFHSGDLAVVHPDGYIEIMDRAKDVIISGGENISSVEVESLLYEHPAVLEAAVVGVPDTHWGEVPKALVVLKPHHQASAQELITFCRDRMAHFKAPKSVEFVDTLPKTATGKVQKFALRAQYAQAEGVRGRGSE